MNESIVTRAIGTLTSASTPLTGTELFVLEQSGTAKKVSGTVIQEYFRGKIGTSVTDITVTRTSGTGAAGTTDTYTGAVTYRNAEGVESNSYFTFQVYNGEDGAEIIGDLSVTGIEGDTVAEQLIVLLSEVNQKVNYGTETEIPIVDDSGNEITDDSGNAIVKMVISYKELLTEYEKAQNTISYLDNKVADLMATIESMSALLNTIAEQYISVDQV